MYEQQKRWEGYAGMAMESCAVKTVLAGSMGASVIPYCVVGIARPNLPLVAPCAMRLDRFRYWCLLLANVRFIRIRGPISTDTGKDGCTTERDSES